mmetsp:Transcript_30461/g.75698  ORF Transcript_30461/g.75698 Transcript_30461/m.75698 type:complete len:236 (-) Transcript_30461:497-1204(-)
MTRVTVDTSRPRDSTSVEMRILVRPSRNSLTTRSRSVCSMPPSMAVHLYPASFIVRISRLHPSRVRTKMMVCPILSHSGKIFSLSRISLASVDVTLTRCCLMTSSDSSCAGRKIWLAPGTTLVEKSLTRSLKVAEKSSTCGIWRVDALRCFMILSESTRCPSVSIIWSASSNTSTLMEAQLSCFSRIHPSTLPGVPMTTWSTILSRLLAPVHRGSAVYARLMPVYLPIFSITITF